jgi:hypothetical protein
LPFQRPEPAQLGSVSLMLVLFLLQRDGTCFRDSVND